ncbi:MAG: hypothetical protein U1F43_30115 [Myxococcota bacterium]
MAMTLALGASAVGCSDRGRVALDAIVEAAEALATRLESGPPPTPAELEAFADRTGPALLDQAREEARMLEDRSGARAGGALASGLGAAHQAALSPAPAAR